MLFRSTASLRRCLGFEVGKLSCLADGMPFGAGLDLFPRSTLTRMRIFMSAINFGCEWYEHVTEEASAVIKFCFFSISWSACCTRVL